MKKSLSVRTHICPNCGLVMDRDQNAVLNILQKVLSSDRGCTVGADGNRRACPVKRFWTGGLYCWTSNGQWQVPWMKEEPPSIYGGECQNMDRALNGTLRG